MVYLYFKGKAQCEATLFKLWVRQSWKLLQYNYVCLWATQSMAADIVEMGLFDSNAFIKLALCMGPCQQQAVDATLKSTHFFISPHFLPFYNLIF